LYVIDQPDVAMLKRSEAVWISRLGTFKPHGYNLLRSGSKARQAGRTLA
jgi:hypothetical protein